MKSALTDKHRHIHLGRRQMPAAYRSLADPHTSRRFCPRATFADPTVLSARLLKLKKHRKHIVGEDSETHRGQRDGPCKYPLRKSVADITCRSLLATTGPELRLAAAKGRNLRHAALICNTERAAWISLCRFV